MPSTVDLQKVTSIFPVSQLENSFSQGCKYQSAPTVWLVYTGLSIDQCTIHITYKYQVLYTEWRQRRNGPSLSRSRSKKLRWPSATSLNAKSYQRRRWTSKHKRRREGSTSHWHRGRRWRRVYLSPDIMFENAHGATFSSLYAHLQATSTFAFSTMTG